MTISSHSRTSTSVDPCPNAQLEGLKSINSITTNFGYYGCLITGYYGCLIAGFLFSRQEAWYNQLPYQESRVQA
jgi:hypothetical protein